MKIKSSDYYRDGGSLSLETNLGEIVVDYHFESNPFGSKVMHPLAGRCTWGSCDQYMTKEERAKIKELTIEEIKELLQILDNQIDEHYKTFAKRIRTYYNL